MLSILIPCYNYDVRELVNALHSQASTLEVNFEIIIFDDGSNGEISPKNESLNALKGVLFKTLPKNVGLSENRNLLTAEAQYDYLLFIDGDSLLEKEYLKNYIEAIGPEPKVIYGGRKHPQNFQFKKESIRWKYGYKIEDKQAIERQITPYASTLFNNTLIHESIFETIQFDKNLTQYGHEDTLYSYQLKQNNMGIKHIDNPVIHGDIDSNSVFLDKTEKGLTNLSVLYKLGKINPDYVRLLRFYQKLKKYKFLGLIKFGFGLIEFQLKKNILSNNPSLKVFTLYKIGYFTKINA